MEHVQQARRNVREWKRVRFMYKSGAAHFYTNGVDDTARQISSLSHFIDQNEALISKFDPKGQTRDADVEMGEVAPSVVPSLWHGRHVSHAVDEDGLAIDLRLFDTESEARADALAPGRFAGVIGREHWSVSPFSA